MGAISDTPPPDSVLDPIAAVMRAELADRAAETARDTAATKQQAKRRPDAA